MSQLTIFSHVRTFSLVEPVLSNEDKVSSLRAQHCTDGGIWPRDLLIISLALYYKLSCHASLHHLDEKQWLLDLDLTVFKKKVKNLKMFVHTVH